LRKSDGFLSELATAERTLARRDSRLRSLIKDHGPCRIRPHTRYSETLIGSVISQQLSTKAADTIYRRFLALYAPARFPTAAQVLATPDEALRATGMSGAKVSFVKDLVARQSDGRLKLRGLHRLTDQELIEMLTQVKGIGVWTAHMFLIFSLGRLDVLPVGDLGIRRAIERLYGFDQLPSGAEIERLAAENGWSPFCSVASWYLWRSLG
jgi:DNA-3-methyladenine glycosylase II